MDWMGRQGDVLIRSVGKPGKNAKLKDVGREKGRVILAHGEATGHAHAILHPKVTMFRDDNLGRSLLRVDEQCEIVHEEHDTITLEPGWYEVKRQREYRDPDRGEGFRPKTFQYVRD